MLTLYEQKYGSEIVHMHREEKGKSGVGSLMQFCLDGVEAGMTREQLFRERTALMNMTKAVDVCFQHFKKRKEPALPKERWYADMEIPFEKTPFLHGDPGDGKTTWALQHFKTPCEVGGINDLRMFDEAKHDGIVISDLNTKDMSREDLIHLVDRERTVSVRVLYGTVVIPYGTGVIWTSNKSFVNSMPPGACDKAHERRVHIVHVSELKDLRQTPTE